MNCLFICSFSFEICTDLQGDIQGGYLKHDLVAESEALIPRVWFQNSDKLNKITHDVFSKHSCKNYTLYLKEDTRDILKPIQVIS